MRYGFERTVRTATSEQWLVFAPESAEQQIGTFDIHISPDDIVYGTLVLTGRLSEQELDNLIKHFDDDVVNMADLEKGNFHLSVYQGQEVGHYKIQAER